MLKSQTACDFDWQQLSQLAGEDADFEAELLSIFLQDAENSLNKIGDAIATQNTLAVEEAAHSLKGASANVGAKALANTAAQLENLARSGQLTNTKALLQQLTRHCDSVQTHLKARR